MPKVSIIIPTFNRANYLKLAIESILNQNFDDFEIIITDNDSTDNTVEIVGLFDDSRIKYHKNSENVGVVENYNVALKYSSGKYIHVFSDDDIMLKNCLINKVNILDKYASVGLVHSNIRMIDSFGNIASDSHWANQYYDHWNQSHGSSRLFKGLSYFNILINNWNIISMPSVLLRSSLLEKIGEFDPQTHFICDWDFWLRICLHADVFYVNEQLIEYRFHSNNVNLSSSKEDISNELLYMKQKLRELLTDQFNRKKIAKLIVDQDIQEQIKRYPLQDAPSPNRGSNFLISQFKRIFKTI